MSTVIYVSTKEPNTPASDQHPDAARYIVAGLWVDALGGEPTQAEIDAILSPEPPKPDPLLERIAVLETKLARSAKLEAALIDKAVITKADVDAKAVEADAIKG